MKKVKCVKCGAEVEINISKALDEDGEVFRCPHCKQKFRYTDKIS